MTAGSSGLLLVESLMKICGKDDRKLDGNWADEGWVYGWGGHWKRMKEMHKRGREWARNVCVCVCVWKEVNQETTDCPYA